MSEYRELGYSVPTEVIGYDALAGVLGFYAKKHEKESGALTDKFILNNVCAGLIRNDKERKTTLWLNMHPVNTEPRFLCDLLSDKRVILFHDRPSKETPLQSFNSK